MDDSSYCYQITCSTFELKFGLLTSPTHPITCLYSANNAHFSQSSQSRWTESSFVLHSSSSSEYPVSLNVTSGLWKAFHVDFSGIRDVSLCLSGSVSVKRGRFYSVVFCDCYSRLSCGEREERIFFNTALRCLCLMFLREWVCVCEWVLFNNLQGCDENAVQSVLTLMSLC